MILLAFVAQPIAALVRNLAFGPILQPNVCVLLDVGTMPRSKSIYHLWKAFDINSNVGGACGEVRVILCSSQALHRVRRC